jgi:hypothetical protein
VKVLGTSKIRRYFRIKHEYAYPDLRKIHVGVPQGSVLGPILYLLYTSDLPTLQQTIVATFADDTAIMAIGDNNSESTQKLQIAITEVKRWTRKWQIKLNNAKSVHIDFTNQCVEHKPI